MPNHTTITGKIMPLGARLLQRPSTSADLCLRCRAALFSTTQVPLKGAERNKNRGVSALRRTGPRTVRALSKEPLPQPVLDPARRSKIQVNGKHGLWEFFDKEKTPFEKPEVIAAHGTTAVTALRQNLCLRVFQVEHGLSKSSDTSPSRICIACGGSA